MLVITGDTEVADVYFTEFARMFQHFYARWWASQLDRGGDANERSFLEETDTWQGPYWNPRSPKSAQRELFMQTRR